MPTIALRVPTVAPGQAALPSGQCYILFPRGPITARELIAEKVRAELRKARAGGMLTTSLPMLLPDGAHIGFRLLDEQLPAEIDSHRCTRAASIGDSGSHGPRGS